MGQKVNPHGLRVGVIKDWDSRWYAKNEDVGELLASDYKIRKFLKSTLYSAGIPRIEIERDSAKVRIYLHCARPGVVIGKGGTEIERLRLQLEKMLGKPVALNIVEVRSPDLTAQLIAENIAQQLEKRISFRRAMKQAIQRATRLGARGIKVAVSGRLGGAEIARSEHYHEGTIPLQTLRADIDYGFAEAATTYGRIGVKVWVYKGEILSSTLRENKQLDTAQRRDRRERRDRRSSDQGGYNRRPQGQGGYNSRPQGQGGYAPRPQGQGGYSSRPQGQGGFAQRPQSGSNPRPQGQGGFGQRPQGQGGYNSRPQGQGGFAGRQNSAAQAPRPEAPAVPKEGGDN